MTNAMQGRCYTNEYDQKLEKDSLILDLNENLSTGLVPRGRHMRDNLGSGSAMGQWQPLWRQSTIATNLPPFSQIIEALLVYSLDFPSLLFGTLSGMQPF